MPHLSRKARILLASLAVAAAHLWTLAAAGAWLFQPGPRGEAFMVAAATTVTLLAGMVTCTLWGNEQRWKRQQDLLVWSIADLTRRADAPTVPLHSVPPTRQVG